MKTQIPIPGGNPLPSMTSSKTKQRKLRSKHSEIDFLYFLVFLRLLNGLTMELSVAQTLAALPGSMKAENNQIDSDFVNKSQKDGQSDSADEEEKRVLLDRKTLLATSSRDFEEYLTTVSKTRSLSTSEQRQLRAQDALPRKVSGADR